MRRFRKHFTMSVTDLLDKTRLVRSSFWVTFISNLKTKICYYQFPSIPVRPKNLVPCTITRMSSSSMVPCLSMSIALLMRKALTGMRSSLVRLPLIRDKGLRRLRPPPLSPLPASKQRPRRPQRPPRSPRRSPSPTFRARLGLTNNVPWPSMSYK